MLFKFAFMKTLKAFIQPFCMLKKAFQNRHSPVWNVTNFCLFYFCKLKIKLTEWCAKRLHYSYYLLYLCGEREIQSDGYHIWWLIRCTFFSLGERDVPENHTAFYKVMGQLWVSGSWSSSAAVALELKHKYLQNLEYIWNFKNDLIVSRAMNVN